MWTIEIEICDGNCGSEVTLRTDGRVAYAHASGHRPGWTQGETTEVWREGIVLALTCPATEVVHGDRCGERIVFTGEGEEAPEMYMGAEPILDKEPQWRRCLSAYDGGMTKLASYLPIYHPLTKADMVNYGRRAIRAGAEMVAEGDHPAQVKEWAATAISLMNELERTEARLDECRKARREGY
jgi:hypothetical protein